MLPSLSSIRWRIVWTSVLGLILSLGFFYLHQWAFAPADDQCTWSLEKGRVLIQEILPYGVAEDAGILDGDELVAINGRSLQPTQESLLQAQMQINSLPADRIVIYTLRREGRELYLPIRLTKPLGRTQCIVLLAGLVAWGIGLLVAISSPRRKVARHFYYLGLTALLATTYFGAVRGSFPATWLVALQAISSLVRAVLPALWIHFALRFPHPFALRRQRRFLAGLYGTFLFLGLLNLILLLGARWLPGFATQQIAGRLNAPIVGPTLSIATLIALAAALGLFWAGSRRVQEPHRRALLPALILSTAFALDLLLFAGLSLRSAGQSLMFQREAWVFFAPLPLLPISFAYAIFRHGLFEVRRAILRWLSYCLVTSAVLVAYLGALAWTFDRVRGVGPELLGVAAGLAALPVGWLLRATLLTLRRTFRRDIQRSRDLVLRRLRRARTHLSEGEVLASLELGLREAFRPQLLSVGLLREDSVELPSEEAFPPVGTRDRLVLPQALMASAREQGELVLPLETEEAEWLQTQAPGVRRRLEDLGAQILVLLMAGEEPRAAVLLGGKYAELGFGREDRELLGELAVAAGMHLEMALAHQRLLDQGRLEQEMMSAHGIQAKLISATPPPMPGFQCAFRLDPALETGGDLLQVWQPTPERWMAAVGDVSGKGLPAALYMSQAIALLRFATRHQDCLPLQQLMPELDSTLRGLLGPSDFLTLTVLEWDAQGGFRLVRAGHPAALLLRGGDGIEPLMPQGRGLGLRPAGEADWGILEGRLQPGDWIVLYSDGITETMGAGNALYGPERLAARVMHLKGTGSPRAACEAIFSDLAAFEAQGGPPQNRDDRTLFILGREVA
nr:SpoIIE family protein phosphatase [uncultured Holophaga sp.]